MYEIGKIITTHGIKGEVKVYSYTDFNRFKKGESCFVVRNNEKTYFEITGARQQKNVFIVKFKGYDNINDVLEFKDLMLYSDNDKRESLEKDDYRYDMLIGKKVFVENKEIGEVISIIDVPQGHLLEISIAGVKKLVPFRKEFVSQITDEMITIIPIEGLLWKLTL